MKSSEDSRLKRLKRNLCHPLPLYWVKKKAIEVEMNKSLVILVLSVIAMGRAVAVEPGVWAESTWSESVNALEGGSIEDWIAALGFHHFRMEFYGLSTAGRPPAEAIRAIDPAEAVPRMIEALKSDRLIMRNGAAEGLGLFGAKAAEAVPALIRIVGEDKHPETGEIAADSLAVILEVAGDPPPAELIELLDHESDYAQLWAARAVLAVDPYHEPAMSLLKDVMNEATGKVNPGSEGDRRQRCLVAMRILERLGPAGAAAVPELVEILSRDHVGDGAVTGICRIAPRTLGAIGPAARDALPAMIEALRDPHRAMRDAASQNLAKLTPGVVPTGLLIALDDRNESCRRAAHRALREYGEMAVRVLAIRLTHQDSSVRVDAIRTLMSLPHTTLAVALPTVRQAVQDEDAEVRRMAAVICRRIE